MDFKGAVIVTRTPVKGSELLEEILSGNKRFVQGERTGLCNPVDVDLGTMVHIQSPFAAVLCCSDSRVPPDHVLDRKLGEILVVRVAGKVPGPAMVGSLEYAVEHLKVPLLPRAVARGLRRGQGCPGSY